MARFLRSQDRPLLVAIDQFEDVPATGERPDQDLLDLLPCRVLRLEARQDLRARCAP